MTKKEILDKFLGVSEEKRAEIGKHAFEYIYDSVKKTSEDEDFAFKFAMMILANGVGADGKLSPEEFALVSYILQNSEIDPNQLVEVIKSFQRMDALDMTKKVLDLDKDLKLQACQLAFSVATIDGDVDENENAFLSYLLK